MTADPAIGVIMMMVRRALRAVPLWLLACGAGCETRARPDQRTIATAAAPATAASSSLQTSGAVATNAGAAILTDSSARAACESAAIPWRAFPGTELRVVDTLVGPDDVIEDPVSDTVLPPGATGAGRGARWPACAVVGLAPDGLDSTQLARRYWARSGWGVLVRLNAGGPDGDVQVYQRDWVRCQVADERDGGDDGDSTYVPSPFYRERTLCWRHGRRLVPDDTASMAP